MDIRLIPFEKSTTNEKNGCATRKYTKIKQCNCMETHSNTEFNTIIKVTKSTLKNAVALWISSSVCANAAALSEIQ